MTKKKPPTLVDVNSLGAKSVERLAKRAYPDQKSVHPLARKSRRTVIVPDPEAPRLSRPSCRENKRSLTFFIEKELAKRIKAACVEQEITMQDWLIAAAVTKLGEK